MKHQLQPLRLTPGFISASPKGNEEWLDWLVLDKVEAPASLFHRTRLQSYVDYIVTAVGFDAAELFEDDERTLWVFVNPLLDDGVAAAAKIHPEVQRQVHYNLSTFRYERDKIVLAEWHLLRVGYRILILQHLGEDVSFAVKASPPRLVIDHCARFWGIHDEEP